MDIVNATNFLWACIINDITFDMFGGEIKFIISEPEIEIKHKLIFKKVSSFQWISNYNNIFENNIYPEFTSINFGDVTLQAKHDKWLKQYSLQFNVSIEIMSGGLLINAPEFELDSKTYKIC